MKVRARRRRRDSATERAVTPIGRRDHDLLTFAITWLPYGCPPVDEVLIKFGLTPERYRVRLREAIERHRPHIHPDTAARLLGSCADSTEGRLP